MATPIQLTIDCTDPHALTRFWTQALHYVEKAPPDGSATWVDYWPARGISGPDLAEIEEGYCVIVDPAGAGPRIWFQPVPEPKLAKNRLHLDLDVTDRSRPIDERRPLVDAEVERLLALGATVFQRLSVDGVDHYGVVMQDPEGNEFCVS